MEIIEVALFGPIICQPFVEEDEDDEEEEMKILLIPKQKKIMKSQKDKQSLSLKNQLRSHQKKQLKSR